MRSRNKSGKNSITDGMAVNLNMFGAFVKGWIVGDEDGGLVVAIHWHSFLYWKTKLL